MGEEEFGGFAAVEGEECHLPREAGGEMPRVLGARQEATSQAVIVLDRVADDADGPSLFRKERSLWMGSWVCWVMVAAVMQWPCGCDSW